MTIRLTEKRKRILDVLMGHEKAFSAADIHEQVPDIDLVTIYRSLELFQREKSVKRIGLGRNEAKFEYQKEPHHHAICTDCERVLHFKASDKAIIELLGLKNFEVDELEVIVKGKCLS